MPNWNESRGLWWTQIWLGLSTANFDQDDTEVCEFDTELSQSQEERISLWIHEEIRVGQFNAEIALERRTRTFGRIQRKKLPVCP